MAKAFSEQEREMINKKLITACEECWNLYGYQKTSIRDLCSRCGISPGAFYLFYETKELLFLETAIRAGKRLSSIIDQNMPPDKPTKDDFAKAFKIMIKELQKAKWQLSIYNCMEIFRRKLSPEQFKILMHSFSFPGTKFKISLKVPANVASSALDALIGLRFNPKMTGEHYDKAYELIIDSTIDRLFE
jgi:AcrR family transcriptional regulator